MKKIQSVGVIGLGSMGMGAAKSCIRAGLDVYGFDLNPQALKILAEYGAKAVSTNALELADKLDALLILVVNAEQVNSVLFKHGLAAALKPNTPVMVSATISAQDAKQIQANLAKHNLVMLDAPVSGGAVKAEAGEMTIMASGAQSTFEVLEPVLSATATKVYNIGETIGLGATVKIIHQLLAGVHIAAGAEAMALAARANIPLDLMYDIVTHAAGNSWMFENRMKHVVDGDYSPKSMVDIFVKDLNLVSETAKDLKFPLSLSSAALNMFVSASNAGFGQEDDSAVIKIFDGIKLPGVESNNQ
ncbi:MAG: L-threonate dehydrogenase [Vibrio sp.]|uniref:L-threonate dehydrogenase n=1 Tax=Vibrio chanodichtyis TaxID=3027932 RepID=A0ABT5UX36_9VIBR|nr:MULTISPECIES: L-threonate dehydrogenase [Vibrio]MDE1513984.1 NAD(P)-dependent oxidoreductase [Vibrio chanodichtyis]